MKLEKLKKRRRTTTFVGFEEEIIPSKNEALKQLRGF